ncbi:MAG TPA: TetR/AcrR family transcriptional regulator [Candidatus Deferrimicrobiaceae bacterium]|jgi:AcrR family transcriptional regulator
MSNKGSLTRQSVIDKSLQIFSVKGYYNASINDILEATGLTKGGFYGHFASKEDLWTAAYDKAVEIWKGIVFKGIREIDDPIERLAKTIENDLQDYIGSGVFDGGCFFFNNLVELSGQSAPLSGRILRGLEDFSRLLASWLAEADRKGMLRPGLDLKGIADFVVVSVNGAAALYSASRDPRILRETVMQLRSYLDHLKA